MTRRVVTLVSLVVALPFVLLLAAPPAHTGGFCTYEPLSDRTQSSVDMKENCFFPMVVRVESGGTVTWKNYDKSPHTLTAPGGWGSGHKEFFNGDKAKFQFDEDGVYPYVCLLHPGMVGAVVVGDGETDHKGAATMDGGTGSGGASSVGEEAGNGAAQSETSASVPARSTEDGATVLLLAALIVAGSLTLFGLRYWMRRRLAERSDAVG